ncbi:MAG: TetR/AcrR family transcriptional regulator, partial [Myxococcota bacterium]
MATAPDGLTRRERERLRHRAEILAAARRIVEEKGLLGLTIEEVARQAQFAVGSIYRHFRGKDELVEMLMVRISEPICADAEAVAAAGGTFDEQLYHVVRSLYLHLEEDLPLLKAFHAGTPPGTEVGERLLKMRIRYVEAVERVIVAGQAEGVLRPGDPRPLTVALLGTVSGFVRWGALALTERPSDPAAALCAQFLDGA